MRLHRFDSTRHRARRAVFGLSIVFIGGLALLDNLRMSDLPLLRTFWPLLLVLWGLARLVWPSHRAGGLLGLAMVVAGGLMTAHNLGHLELDLRHWWPVFVILAGLSIALRGLFPRRLPDLAAGVGFTPSTIEHGDRVQVDATFSAVKLQNDSRQFKGGRIDASFGGVELDLRQAAIEGAEAELVIAARFAGIELRVPREWKVVVELATSVGAVDDKTVPPLGPGPRLVLRGESFFGGVEIRH